MTTLITGASRGLGLEHVRQALAVGEDVIAACRDPDGAAELRGLAGERLRIAALDVANGDSVAGLAARLGGVAIDRLINNAGIFGGPPWPEGGRQQTLETMDFGKWEALLRTNLLGPFHVTAALLPNLLAAANPLIVMMTSDMASIGGNTLGLGHAYRSSKAGLNMLARGLAVDLRERGVTVVALTPGWTRTAMGGDAAPVGVADSVAAQRAVLAKLTLADSGRFLDRTGADVAW